MLSEAVQNVLYVRVVPCQGIYTASGRLEVDMVAAVESLGDSESASVWD